MIASRAEPHLPAIGVLMAAAGVAPEAAHLLVEAMTTGQELVLDLASRTGWAVGVAARPLDATALPAPPEAFTEEQRKANLKRLGALARSLGAKKAAS